jgi:Predicted membrane protein (DUF2254)
MAADAALEPPPGGPRAPGRAMAARRPLATLAVLVGSLAAFAVAVFAALWLLDFFLVDAAHRGARGPGAQLFAFDPETMQNALGSLAQVIAAVLGIAITVVSIVVQLAANRYTSRVADMFFRDRINLGVMGFFVVACIEAVWVSLSVTKDFVPQVTIAATVAMATASLLVLVPYFAYVFAFLDPEKVIARLGNQTLASALAGGHGRDARAVGERQAQAVAGMEQLAGIAVNALAQNDKVIATDATAALRRVLVDYVSRKATLEPGWFAIGAALRANPDFVAMTRDAVEELARERVWLEWKGLKQIHAVLGEALTTMPEMAHVAAIDTRYVGEAALRCGDREVVALTVRFMNTYLRSAVNARDVRTAYNVLNQYRQLAESMLRATRGAAPWLPAMVEGVAGHFKYYAQLAHGQGLGFVAEAAAYDLSELCEVASQAESACHDRLLSILLEIDKEAETTAQEKALRGVRKAQVKLATFYLLHEQPGRARAIYQDMAHESPERLRSIRDEMLAITSKQFWEVVDRGANFDYLDDARKAKLRDFFAGFPQLATAVA